LARERAVVVPTPNAAVADGVVVMNRSRPFSSSFPPRNYRCKAWAVQAAEFLGPAPQEPGRFRWLS